jgi:hypothetical protein
MFYNVSCSSVIYIKTKIVIFSQSKKILVASISVFVVSLSMLLFFLEGNGSELGFGQTDALSSSSHSESSEQVEAIIPDNIIEKPALWLQINDLGLIVDSSENLCELLHISSEELRGLLVYDLINAKDLPLFASASSKLMQSGEKMKGIGPFRILAGDTELIFMLNASPNLDEKGAVLDIIFELKDITAQVKEMAISPEPPKGIESPNRLEQNKSWLRDLYPKFLDSDEEIDTRMMVDNII